MFWMQYIQWFILYLFRNIPYTFEYISNSKCMNNINNINEIKPVLHMHTHTQQFFKSTLTLVVISNILINPDKSGDRLSLHNNNKYNIVINLCKYSQTQQWMHLKQNEQKAIIQMKWWHCFGSPLPCNWLEWIRNKHTTH